MVAASYRALAGSWMGHKYVVCFDLKGVKIIMTGSRHLHANLLKWATESQFGGKKKSFYRFTT